VPDINEKCVDFSKKGLRKLGKKLISQFPAKRVVTVADCSSSGKSTFSRLIARE
jgi:tRNA A37 threonylcarbamoyladenosine biosynthesis protein TsaE